MVIFDANAILRIILLDNELMANESKKIIKSNEVLVKNEVLAEVIYVLLKVYKVDKPTICSCILKLLDVKNIKVESKDTIICAINTFESNNIDFVDCILFAYYKIENYEIFTFDKKLNTLLYR